MHFPTNNDKERKSRATMPGQQSWPAMLAQPRRPPRPWGASKRKFSKFTELGNSLCTGGRSGRLQRGRDALALRRALKGPPHSQAVGPSLSSASSLRLTLRHLYR